MYKGKESGTQGTSKYCSFTSINLGRLLNVCKLHRPRSRTPVRVLRPQVLRLGTESFPNDSRELVQWNEGTWREEGRSHSYNYESRVCPPSSHNSLIFCSKGILRHPLLLNQSTKNSQDLLFFVFNLTLNMFRFKSTVMYSNHLRWRGKMDSSFCIINSCI